MSDFDQTSLLRRFEPILKFTHGEKFFPYDVADYVSESGLWKKDPGKLPEEIIPEKDLDLSVLGSLQLRGASTIYYLQFISPLNIMEIAELRFKELQESVQKREFRLNRSRLTRVGYLARLVDGFFSLLLLLRGRVPGDSMMAAVVTFNEMLSGNRSFKYYGRVIHQGGWIILQYWYFYPFNNWRSGFYGANDHEADWEMVNIYCYPDNNGDIKPAWVAYASHNFSGDDLRRHWDDPELEKAGEHPVVYVGGGSHASYFRKGEYLTQLSLPFFNPIKKIIAAIAKIISQIFRENQVEADHNNSTTQLFTIPFVDYALGDGLSIGPGCDESWSEPDVIEPAPDWVQQYRGLWGYFAQDPFSGENAPAGPRYNPDGTVRRAWFDPLGWAGMEKVAPPNERAEILANRIEEVKKTIKDLKNEIEEIQSVHYQRGIDLAAHQDAPHLHSEVQRIQTILSEEQKTMAEKRQRLSEKRAALESLERYDEIDSVESLQPIRAHLRHAHQPQDQRDLRFRALAEIWAAVSIGMMMIGVVLLILFARHLLLVGLGLLLLAMITIESAFRRRLSEFVRWTSIVLAMVAFFILLYQFFWIIALIVIMVIGFYMIIENLKELFAQ